MNSCSLAYYAVSRPAVKAIARQNVGLGPIHTYTDTQLDKYS